MPEWTNKQLRLIKWSVLIHDHCYRFYLCQRVPHDEPIVYWTNFYFKKSWYHPYKPNNPWLLIYFDFASSRFLISTVTSTNFTKLFNFCRILTIFKIKFITVFPSMSVYAQISCKNYFLAWMFFFQRFKKWGKTDFCVV